MSKYKFYNKPISFEHKDYAKSRKAIVSKYKSLRGLTAIYEWGAVKNPGISDIDILFIFNKKSKHLPLANRSYALMDKTTRYLARHPFVFMDIESFKKINYIYKNTDFHLLHGKKITRNKLTKKEAREVQLATVNDIIIRHYPRDFLYQIVHKKINVRDSLLRLNSIKYTIKTLSELTGKKYTKWNSFTNTVAALRENWFRAKDTKKLTESNKKAIIIVMEIIDEFLKHIKKNKIIECVGKAHYNGIKNKTIFVEHWSKEAALKEMKKLEEKNTYHSILPVELAPHLTEYARARGPISSYIKNNMNGRIQYNMKHTNILSKRIQILNNQANLALNLRHSDFTAFFDFGYRNKTGINNWALQLLDKIKYS